MKPSQKYSNILKINSKIIKIAIFFELKIYNIIIKIFYKNYLFWYIFGSIIHFE